MLAYSGFFMAKLGNLLQAQNQEPWRQYSEVKLFCKTMTINDQPHLKTWFVSLMFLVFSSSSSSSSFMKNPYDAFAFYIALEWDSFKY
jgi:hypothetical protein